MLEEFNVELVKKESIDIKNFYLLVEQIYKSSNSFCESFDEKYPTTDDLKKEIDNERVYATLVKIKDQLAGYLILTPKSEMALKHTAFLSMGVAPGFQGSGLGSLLIETMLKERSKDIEIVYLMVRADNESAIKLYQKFKFKTVARLEKDTKINNKYYDGLLMSQSFFS